MPAALNNAGLYDREIITPTGLMPEFFDICGRIARDAVAEPASSDLVLVAHGTGRNRDIFQFMEAMPDELAGAGGFRRCILAFLEQEPTLETLDLKEIDGICLPVFSLPGGHVEEDIPPGLAAAGFQGEILPPVGMHPYIFAMVAGLVKKQYP